MLPESLNFVITFKSYSFAKLRPPFNKKAVSKIYEYGIESDDNKLADYNSLEVLLKYDIITPENAEQLIKENKLKVEDADVLIEKYKKEKKK